MHARLTDEKPAFGSSCVYGAGGGSRRLSGGRGDEHEGSLIWNRRRSMCERINEEKDDINVEISGQRDVPSPTTRLADFDYLSVYKRHHRPRPIIPTRSSSAPNLIDILLSDHPTSLNQPHPQPHPPSLPSPPPQKRQQRRPSGRNGMANLLPRIDSFGARTRGASHIDFRTATTGVIGKAMRNELSQLVNTVQDPQTRKASLVFTIYSTPILIFLQAFDTEMQSFFYLFTRYLAERAQAQELSTPFFLSSLGHSADFSFIETGNVSSPLAMTRSCLTIHSRSLRTRLPSVSWPFSRLTEVWVPPWV
jgi:hypothetical protein